jgi:transposase
VHRRSRLSGPLISFGRTCHLSPGVHLKLSRISLAANNLSSSFREFGKPSSLDGGMFECSAALGTASAGPPPASTYWTGTAMAEAVGISVSSVQRVWRAHGLQPHRVRQFKLSNDPQFVAKLRDIVGLYVCPPDHAIVLSIDEKSQIQALDRTQPGLPMKKGRTGTLTHDYKRHGTTTLFAALDVLEGKVIGQCMKRHRHQEFIRFLNVIDARVAQKKTVHVIVDNYAAHKHPKVLEWLARHPRFVFHFTPTSASWLNAVEGLFATLTKRRLKRGVFRSIQELKHAIHSFIADTNAKPKPFIWTKEPDKIIAAAKRGHQVLDSIH